MRADLIYKVVHGLSAIPFDVLFEFDNSGRGRTRGHSLKLRKKRCRLDLKFISFRRKWLDYGFTSRRSLCDCYIIEFLQEQSFKT